MSPTLKLPVVDRKSEDDITKFPSPSSTISAPGPDLNNSSGIGA